MRTNLFHNPINRRRLLLGAAAGAASAALAQPAPADRLTAWMYMIWPLEQWLTGYQRILDAWEEGGVRGIVIGPLRFWDGEPKFDFTYRRAGATIQTCAPDPAIYRKYGVDAPANVRLDPAKEKQLHGLLDNIANRGWDLRLFGPAHYGRRKSFEQDPFGALSLAAGVEDTLRAFPQAKGVIIDGAGEHHYELAFHHGGDLFEIRDHHRAIYTYLGFDVARMERGMNHLKARFHSLTPSLVRFHQNGGMLGGLSLFDLNEDSLYWLRMRQESTLRNMTAIRKQWDALPKKSKLGTIPRSAAFSVLTTQDYQKTHHFFDTIFPKHYYWHRGFDGMYGTIARWVATLHDWNPSLTEEDCFGVVRVLFGLNLPKVKTLADLENGFPDEFFDEIVFAETKRALDATGDPEKVIAWVSTGRNPHAGDPMPATPCRPTTSAASSLLPAKPVSSASSITPISTSVPPNGKPSPASVARNGRKTPKATGPPTLPSPILGTEAVNRHNDLSGSKDQRGRQSRVLSAIDRRDHDAAVPLLQGSGVLLFSSCHETAHWTAPVERCHRVEVLSTRFGSEAVCRRLASACRSQ